MSVRGECSLHTKAAMITVHAVYSEPLIHSSEKICVYFNTININGSYNISVLQISNANK